MFKDKVRELVEDVRKIYSYNITAAHAHELQDIVDSFGCHMELLAQQISQGWFFMWTHQPATMYSGTCYLMIQQGLRDFAYVCCKTPTYSAPMLLFFDKTELSKVKQKVIRIEKLKAFL